MVLEWHLPISSPSGIFSLLRTYTRQAPKSVSYPYLHHPGFEAREGDRPARSALAYESQVDLEAVSMRFATLQGYYFRAIQ